MEPSFSPKPVKIVGDLLMPDLFYAVTHKNVGVLAMFADPDHAKRFFDGTAGATGGWSIKILEFPMKAPDAS